MACPRRCLWTLVLLLAPTLAAQAVPAGGGADAPALFSANCAKCHGLDGSGTGPAVLDRPARNFKEGGFSFGNTAETIARTIAYGIPGSPMPAFDTALDAEQLHALAEYVVTLGPPVKEVSEAETLLHVTDRPLVVRGILPPLVEGEHNIPRGLLIGTPDGLTFEYAADDVRLLAVRQGDFVRRTDWGGRGGTPLEPLGKVVWSDDALGGPWSLDAAGPPGTPLAAQPLSARLLSTSTSPRAAITYALTPLGEPAPAFALVTEASHATSVGEHAGFCRSFHFAPLESTDSDEVRTIELRLGGWTKVLAPERFAELPGRGRCSEQWWMRDVAENVGEALRIVSPLGAENGLLVSATVSGLTGRLDLGSDLTACARVGPQDVKFELETFVLTPWTPKDVAKLQGEVER